MPKDADDIEDQLCPGCGQAHEAGQKNCSETARQPLKIGAYTAQLCSYCGQKHRGGRDVCQGTDDEDTPVLPGRKRNPLAHKQKHKKDGLPEGSGELSEAAKQGENDDTAGGAGRKLPQAQFNRSSQRQMRGRPKLSAGDEDPGDDDEFPKTVRAQTASVSDDANSPEDLVGHTLSNRYALLGLIGKGGMSAVYKAKDIKLNKPLAVKVLLPHLMANPLSHQRFQVEAQAASSLAHPNLIVTHDFGVTLDGRPYLVMELVDGESLAEILKRHERLPLERAVPIFIQICDALSHAHAKGVLHRDLKPSNVMISPAGGGIDFVRLLDFGIAKVMPQEGAESMGLTKTGEVFGSPNYMSPEQCSGAKVDPRADIYSMGCLMYEVLSGQPPLCGENIMETLLKQMNDPPPDFKTVNSSLNIPQQMELIVFKALAKNPNERYQTAESLGEALRAFQQNVTVLLLKHLQDRWQVIKLKIRPLKGREKVLLAFATIITLMFAVAAVRLVMPYFEMETRTSFPVEKAFMPIPVPRPAVPPPEEPIFIRTIEIKEDMLKADPNSERFDDYRRSVEGLADNYVQENYYKEAAVCYRSLYQLNRQHDGKAARGTRMALERLADCDFKLGNYREAAQHYNELIETGHDDQQTNHFTELRLKQATSLYALGDYSAALPVFQRVARHLQNSDHFKVEDAAVTSARIAECYRQRSLWNEAIRQYENAADSYKQLQHDGGYFNTDNVSEIRSTLVNFYRAFCLYKLDKLEAAAKAYKAVIPKLNRLSGPGRDMTVAATMQYADILWRQGNYIDAIKNRMKAKELRSLWSE
jgi:serine/threonine protein kinase